MFFEIGQEHPAHRERTFWLMNPIGGSPVFLLLTREYAAQQRKLRAGRVAINSFILLIR